MGITLTVNSFFFVIYMTNFSSLSKKMFWIFLVFGRSEISYYNLLPPFKLNYGCEVGNWTVSGNTIVQNQYIQLISHVEYDHGGICNRIPTYAEQWEVTSEFSPGGTGGEGISFFHTRELCSQNIDEYTGMAIFINISEINSGLLPVFYRYVHNQDDIEKTYQYMCDIDNKGHPFTIKIAKTGTGFTMSYKTPVDLNYSKCFEVEETNMVSEGYFSFLSFNSKYHTGDLELLGVDVKLNSPYEEPVNDTSNELNRKYLEKSYHTRRIKKEKRRSQMKVIYKLLNQSIENAMKLDGNNTELIDALLEIKETIFRLKKSITMNQIKQIIGPILQQRFQRMSSVNERALQIKQAIYIQIIRMWNETVQDLADIGDEIRFSMDQSKLEVLNYTQEFLKEQAKYIFVAQAISDSDEERASSIERILFLIVAIEVTLYILFVLYNRFIADLLKKID